MDKKHCGPKLDSTLFTKYSKQTLNKLFTDWDNTSAEINQHETYKNSV